MCIIQAQPVKSPTDWSTASPADWLAEWLAEWLADWPGAAVVVVAAGYGTF